MEIRLLSQEVIHRIAAGEVVDRPASVLKELLDNSIDAGSRHLKVLLIDGGLKTLEIEDDGQGMSRADLEICTLRHATSKISKLDDLDAIQSLGFRGEALAAISSVSKLKIESRQANAEAWTLDTIGGASPQIIPGSCKKGTRIQVSELFFNVPARKKFLKSLGSELSECLEILTSMALAHPEVSFEWHALDGDSGEVKKSGEWPQAELAGRFQQVYGHQGAILYLDHAPSAPEISRAEIAVYRPPVASPYQKTIRLSVNGRPVTDKRLPYALREAMAGLIEIGRYPILQANLTVDVRAVDVNIHPQKKEIRWPANFSLASFLYSILRPQFEVRPESPHAASTENLQEQFFDIPGPIADLSSPASSSPSFSASHSARGALESIPLPPSVSSRPLISSPTESRPDFSFSELRVIGEASASWILCESRRGLIVIDQHAAHERVNFERILTSRDLIRAKPLLIPFTIPADLKWEGIEVEFRRILEEFSFEFSDDGHQIIAVPEADRKIDWAEFLKEVLEDLRSDGGRVKRVDYLKMQLAASLSCHGSVRRGQRLSLEAAQALLKSMDEVQWGGLCPHGRPVWFEITNIAIEESFHR